MRQIARGPFGRALQKTQAGASVLLRQSPAPIETKGFQSREGEGPRKSLLAMVRELVVRMFIHLSEMITRLFAGYGCVSTIENRASELTEPAVNPPIGKQPPRQIIDTSGKERAIKSENITYKPAPLTLPAFFTKEEGAKAKPRKSERSSGWSAGTRGSSTPSRSRHRSISQIAATPQHTLRSNDNPVVDTPGTRQITSSENSSPRMLLTHKPTNKTPE